MQAVHVATFECFILALTVQAQPQGFQAVLAAAPPPVQQLHRDKPAVFNTLVAIVAALLTTAFIYFGRVVMLWYLRVRGVDATKLRDASVQPQGAAAPGALESTRAWLHTRLEAVLKLVGVDRDADRQRLRDAEAKLEVLARTEQEQTAALLQARAVRRRRSVPAVRLAQGSRDTCLPFTML